jgi:hypothetical protein
MDFAKIRFIPFEAETFVPTTAESIESSYVSCANIQNQRDMNNLADILGSTRAGTFDPDMVRARLKLSDGRELFVDKFGGIRSQSGDSSLVPEAFAKLNRLLTSAAKPRPSMAPGC